MTRASKIRINELARELQVKAGEILSMLPKIGIDTVKTHSSSVDSETAVKIRVWFGSSQPEKEKDQPTTNNKKEYRFKHTKTKITKRVRIVIR